MEQPITTKNVGQPCVICGQAADAQATIAALQAQLEQVQEERSKYIQAVGLATTCAADMQIDTSHPIEMMQEVCKRFTQRTAELERVRGLVKALPKVEGAVVVSNGYVKDSTRCHALFGADEDAALYAALLQHRQGME